MPPRPQAAGVPLLVHAELVSQVVEPEVRNCECEFKNVDMFAMCVCANPL